MADGGEIVVTSIRTTRAQLDRFREIAEGEHRTVSQELRHLIAERIAQADVLAEQEVRA